MGLRPDFLLAGWNYGLQTGTSLTPAYLARFGIKTLALTESCANVDPGKQGVSISDTYADLTSLGEIFDVRPRARQLVRALQAQVAAVRAKVAGLRPVSVFRQPTWSPGRSDCWCWPAGRWPGWCRWPAR